MIDIFIANQTGVEIPAMKRKVCVISTVHFLNDTRIFHKEILSLAKQKLSIVFIGRGNPFLLPEIDGVTFYPLPEKPGLMGRVKNIWLAFKQAIRSRAEVYHLHDPELIIIGFVLKWLYGKKIVYDIHELHADEIKYKPYLKHPLNHVAALGYSITEKLATRVFDANILAESEYAQFYSGSNFVAIQNFIPAKYILKSEEDLCAPSDPLQFVYLGSITRVRGAFEMLKFADFLRRNTTRNFNLHLVGPIYPSELEMQMQAEINRTGLEKAVTLHGKLDFPEAQKLLRKCHVGLIFLHPILNNTTILPTKLFEYMGNGLAIMMSDFPLWQKFNHTYGCGLTVDIFNFEKSRDAIVAFLSNPEALRRTGLKNVQIVRNNFLWEFEEKKLFELYERLFAAKK